jgi:putative ABC transport system permease protein
VTVVVSAATTGAVEPSRLRARDALATGTLGLRGKRGRALLTAVGIAIGIAAMVSVVGISASSRADLLAELDELGTNLLQVTPGRSVFGDDSSLPDGAPAMVRRIGPVTAAASTTGVNASVRRTDLIPSSETGGISVVAAEPELADVLDATLAAGRFLDAATGAHPTVVLGAVAAERLGIDSLEGSPTVWLGDQWFTVIGILDPLPLAPDIDRSALIGYDIAAEQLGTERSASALWVRADDDQVAGVRDVLPATANPEHPEEVEVTRPSDALEAEAQADDALTALLLGLGGVALLVGGIGIANVMVISVLERRTEIGLRRALGATRRHVRAQFVVEAIVLAALGGMVGIVLGTAVTAGYAASRDWRLAVPIPALAGGVLVALLVGAVAGLYPAARAARLAPAEAVRPA